MWFAHTLGNDAAAQNIAAFIDIEGPLDEALFETALRHVIDETEALNVRFEESADGPHQVLGRDSDHILTVLDFRDAADPGAAARTWMRKDVAQPVDLLKDALCAFALIRVGAERAFFYHRFHHIIVDELGVESIVVRVSDVYTAMADGDEPVPIASRQLQAVIDDRRSYERSIQREVDRAFWHKRLKGWAGPLHLAGRDLPASSRFVRSSIVLSLAQMHGVVKVAGDLGRSLEHVVLATVLVLLHKLSGVSDLAVGINVSGRSRATRSIPAMLSNVLPLRLTIDPQATLASLMESASSDLRAMVRHQRYPVGVLRREVLGQQSQSFGVSINMMVKEFPFIFRGCFVRRSENISYGATQGLKFQFEPRAIGQAFGIDIDGHADLYGQGDVDLLAARLHRVLDAFVADPGQRVGAIDLLSPAERQQLIVDWNATAHPVPSATLPVLFEAQAARSADAIALVFEEERLSYAELNRAANRLAHHLIGMGIGPEDRVALCLERSPAMVVTLLAILKAGAAYVPLDPDYPSERLAFMLKDARPKAVVTTAGLADGGLFVSAATPLVLLDSADVVDALAQAPATDPTDAEEPRAAAAPPRLCHLHLGLHRNTQRGWSWSMANCRAPCRAVNLYIADGATHILLAFDGRLR